MWRKTGVRNPNERGGIVPNPDPLKVRDIGTRARKQELGLLEMNPSRVSV